MIPIMPWFGLGAIYGAPGPNQGTSNKKGIHTTRTTLHHGGLLSQPLTVQHLHLCRK